MKALSSSSSCKLKRPANSTYLAIGQDLFSIEEYISSQYNYSLHHHTSTPPPPPLPSFRDLIPSTFMVYASLKSIENGLFYPTDYGSGVEYADGIIEMYGDVGVQIGLWLDGEDGCTKIVNGELDKQIDLLVNYLYFECHSSNIFLRLGYEFDNPSFGYSSNPSSYKAAYRYIVDRFHQKSTNTNNKQSINNVYFVWHSWAAPRAQSSSNTSTSYIPLDDFYPGDEYVDWIGISIFQQVYSKQNINVNNMNDGRRKLGEYVYWGGSMSNVKEILDYALSKEKPIMIAESTPFGGIQNDETTTWEEWFVPVLDLIEEYDIAMWCYINSDWDKQPMWHNVGFGNTLLSSNSYVMKQWHSVMYEGSPNKDTNNNTLLATNQQQKKRNFLMADSFTYYDDSSCSYSQSGQEQQAGNFTSYIIILPVLVMFFFLYFLKRICFRRSLYTQI